MIEHHFGDDGSVDVGMILADMTEKRFDALEKRKLVREATPAEVKAGYKPPFDREDEGGPGQGPLTAAERVAEQAQAFITELKEDHEKQLADLRDGHAHALDTEISRANAAETALAQARTEIDVMKTASETSAKDLAEAKTEIETLKAKQEKPPENKKAADPANKGA
ncbi:hypothetical protein U1769_24195 [Sphingomonas sp. ZT3P38]|uniref:hypothetical protein n=1 Tax=Parasphingomonas zepuensis TaxID=3096161 RepID=UPI002FC64FD6